VAAEELDGERIAVTGHRDAAVFDRSVVELFDELRVAAKLVPAAPGPALHATVAAGEAVALTTSSNRHPSRRSLAAVA
jgi:hypothetical protein